MLEPCSRVRSLSRALRLGRELDDLSPEAERLLSHAGDTIHALVPDRGHVSSGKRLTTHLWSKPLPAGSFLKLSDDLFISSPAFIFFQMAGEMDDIELASLGMELCGTYTRTDEPFADVQRRPPDERNPLYEAYPVATIRKIESFAMAAPGAWGARAARRIVAWLENGAASPMEAAVFLMLTLPQRLGGYGLPRPILNPQVKVRTEQGTEARYPDLYWEGKSVDVEYNSDYAHSGNWSRYRDSRRQVILTSNRITVLPLTRSQAMSSDDFHEFAMGLKRLLGLRKRGLDERWWHARAEVRRTLLLPSS